MRICCQDLFFSRARFTDAAHTLVNGAIESGKSPLEKAFQHVRSISQRTNVVSELVNIKVTSINDVDYSEKVIHIIFGFIIVLITSCFASPRHTLTRHALFLSNPSKVSITCVFFLFFK